MQERRLAGIFPTLKYLSSTPLLVHNMLNAITYTHTLKLLDEFNRWFLSY